MFLDGQLRPLYPKFLDLSAFYMPTWFDLERTSSVWLIHVGKWCACTMPHSKAAVSQRPIILGTAIYARAQV